MTKTKKQKNLQDTPEQSTPAVATAPNTVTPSKSSTGESAEGLAEQLKCPVCGGDHTSFKLEATNHEVFCGVCGANTREYAKSPKWGPIIAAWVKKYGPQIPNLPETTPVCKAKSYTKDRVEIACGSQAWKHDGEKLLYCGKCGANYQGKQPDNVKEIIKSLGKQLAQRKYVPRPFTDSDKRKLQDAAKETAEK